MDLAARREVKYVFAHADVGALRAMLRRSCTPIQYAGPSSTVSSLYFDDPRLSTCRANLDGVGLRHKTRLRWYDELRPSTSLFLETKWRRHGVVGKRRMELAASRAPFELPMRQVHRALRSAVAPERQDYLHQESDPVAWIRYQREHFAFHDGEARLTLDYDIRFCGQMGHRHLDSRFFQRLPGVALIECKSAPDGQGVLHRALGPLRARPARFSKYVTACQQLGYVRTA